jgi:hypothetical protein
MAMADGVPDERSVADDLVTPEQGRIRLIITLHRRGSETVDLTCSDTNALPIQSNRGVAKRKANDDLSERSTKQT